MSSFPLSRLISLPRRAVQRLRWEWGQRAQERRLSRRGRQTLGDLEEAPILLFSPEGGIAPHHAALCIAGKTFQQLGRPVVMTTCFRAFRRCSVFDNYGAPFDCAEPVRRQTCGRCCDATEKALESYGLSSVHLNDFLEAETRDKIRRAIESAPPNLLEFRYDSIEFGRLSAMNLALGMKVFDFRQVTEAQRAAWLQFCETSMEAYEISRAMIARIKPRSVVHYNEYAISLGLIWACKRAGVPCYTLTNASHYNVDRRRLCLYPTAAVLHVRSLFERWPRWRDLPLPAPLVSDIVGDILSKFQSRGSHVYSPAKQGDAAAIEKRLELPSGRRLLVAFTSSYDEWTAIRETQAGLNIAPLEKRPAPFPTQIEWLLSLIDFVEKSQDLSLVIRIHPREGRNKRDQTESQHLKLLRSKLPTGPMKAVRIVWPEDTVSSYDLGEAASVALISASNIGLEMARCGVPVLATEPAEGFLPIDDFMGFEANPHDYFKAVRRLVDESDRDPLDRIARALRWHHLFNLASGVDYSNMVPDPHFQGLPPFELPPQGADLLAAVEEGQDIPERVRARLESAGPGAVEAERAALESQLGRLLRFLVTAEDGLLPPGLGLTVEGDTLTYDDGKRRLTRRSPMGARLARALALGRGSPGKAAVNAP